jgi:hypothetical protein
METTVWDRVDANAVRRAARKALTRRHWVDDGEIRLAEPPLSPLTMLVEALPADLSEEEMAEIEDGNLDPWDAAQLVIALLERCDPEKVQDEALVSCWVENSMCGGSWGLRLYTTPRSGYLVYIGDDSFDVEDRCQIYGMWRPVSSEAARRVLASIVYQQNWREMVLPPAMGEYASGMQPLWMECLLDLLRVEPSCWEGIMLQMPRKDDITRERWEFVRRLTGLSDSRLHELYREAGIEVTWETSDGRTHPSRKQAAASAADDPADIEEEELDDEEFDEEEEEDYEDDEASPYEQLIQAAALDPEKARFVVANYCHALEHVHPPDREPESYS